MYLTCLNYLHNETTNNPCTHHIKTTWVLQLVPMTRILKRLLLRRNKVHKNTNAILGLDSVSMSSQIIHLACCTLNRSIQTVPDAILRHSSFGKRRDPQGVEHWSPGCQEPSFKTIQDETRRRYRRLGVIKRKEVACKQTCVTCQADRRIFNWANTTLVCTSETVDTSCVQLKTCEGQ